MLQNYNIFSLMQPVVKFFHFFTLRIKIFCIFAAIFHGGGVKRFCDPKVLNLNHLKYTYY